MAILTKTKQAEFIVLATIVLIVILNNIVFTGLGVAHHESESAWWIIPLTYSNILYLFFLLGSVFAIIFKRALLMKVLFYLFVFVMTLHVIFNLIFLILDKSIQNNGLAILFDAGIILTVSILVFTLWYWIIDRGGPLERELESKDTRYDLLFPQYQSVVPGWDKWKPRFWDYLFFSVITSTSFAPAETLPLTIRVKILMVIEICISLVIIAMVASRAINVLQ